MTKSLSVQHNKVYDNIICLYFIEFVCGEMNLYSLCKNDPE